MTNFLRLLIHIKNFLHIKNISHIEKFLIHINWFKPKESFLKYLYQAEQLPSMKMSNLY